MSAQPSATRAEDLRIRAALLAAAETLRALDARAIGVANQPVATTDGGDAHRDARARTAHLRALLREIHRDGQ